MAYTDDPILRLLPEPPMAFLSMTPEEQRVRGRFWIAMYAAGYAQDMAWWFVIKDDKADWNDYMRNAVDNILPDDPEDYAAMILTRQEAEREMARRKAALP